MTSMMAVCMAVLAAAATPENPCAGKDGLWNVMDFGATPGGEKDCTEAFQKALNAASAANGGTVTVPAGQYRFDGSLTIPNDVTLRGTFSYSPSHTGIRDEGMEKPVMGSVLEPYAEAGKEEGTPFITLHANSTVQGFCVHYPAQDPKAPQPTPYPWTIRMRENNPAVIDVELLNPYNAIDASENQRALIRNIHGQPIHIGIYVDKIYDIGRIENVHWNPWWTMGTPVYQWQMEHGVGFIFGRTDWHYVVNTFCFGYNVGYKFIATKDGATNGNFLGIGADDCYTSLVVEQSAPMGILITNGEFVSFHGPDPTMIRVEKTHTGTVRFSNCAFWGPCNRNAVIDGYGTVGFSDCSFIHWGHKVGTSEGSAADAPSMDIRGGSISLRGCEFMENRPQVKLGPAVERAIITENLIAGKQRIINDSRGNTLIKDNITTPKGKKWRELIQKSPGYRAKNLKNKEKEKGHPRK